MNKPYRMLSGIAVLGISLGLSAAAIAQDNASKSPALSLKGHDPVAYFTEHRAVKGAAKINYDFDDARYLFSTPKNRETFASSPDRYTPQFGGLCTTGLAMGMKTESDPNVWAIVDGKLYVFSSPQAKEMAQKDPHLIEQAQEVWKKMNPAPRRP